MPPASKEFKRVLTETSLGRPMDDALAEMAERVGSKNLSFVVTAVTIQRQVGGSLAGIFDMVADTVRNRQQFARKIRSLTAMGKMSAYVLLGLPFFIAGALTLDEPGVHELALPHVDGPHADRDGLDDDVLRHARAQENRLLQGLITMLLALAVLLLAAAVYLAAELVTQPARERQQALRRASTYGRLRFQSASPDRMRFKERVLAPAAERLARLALR